MNIFTSVNIRDCRLIDNPLHCRLNVKISQVGSLTEAIITPLYICAFICPVSCRLSTVRLPYAERQDQPQIK